MNNRHLVFTTNGILYPIYYKVTQMIPYDNLPNMRPPEADTITIVVSDCFMIVMVGVGDPMLRNINLHYCMHKSIIILYTCCW